MQKSYSQDKIKKLKDNIEMARLDTWSTFAAGNKNQKKLRTCHEKDTNHFNCHSIYDHLACCMLMQKG
jgi:hypothetical protein